MQPNLQLSNQKILLMFWKILNSESNTVFSIQIKQVRIKFLACGVSIFILPIPSKTKTETKSTDRPRSRKINSDQKVLTVSLINWQESTKKRLKIVG